MSYVIPLGAVRPEDKPLIGGKAFTLSLLSRQGITVPEGAVITVEAYRAFVSTAGLAERIHMELGRKRFEDMRWEEDVIALVLKLAAVAPATHTENEPKDRSAMQERFLSAYGDDRRDEALELLDLARASYRLRDDDNLFFGRIEGAVLRAVQEGRTRLRPHFGDAADSKKIFFMLLLILSCSGLQCTAMLPREDFPKAVTYKKKLDMRVMGLRRYYLVHVPINYDLKKKAPLVLVIHGAFSTPEQMEEQSGFSELADREGFLVAYPSGAYGILGFLKHWNAGHCCGKAAGDGIDDVGFLVDVIKEISDQFEVDDTRIYMAGFSNGGMLTYRFAAEQTDMLAAAATLAGALGGKATSDSPIWIVPEPAKPLPMIIFHASDDPAVPYKGGVSPAKEASRNKLDKIALRFGSYLAAAIEQNRRRSWTTSRILRLSRSRRWPEDEMQDVQVIFASLLRVASGNICLSTRQLISGLKTMGAWRNQRLTG